ncbi:MBOAT family protein [Desulfonema ishimotonii]|uniref:MBOAT family protein n=1 Tax=Desulfonema ishimotonii TaxID=45657 RepID=A0A401FZ26_9BACT|nr:MBOAT family protein [Desulfonema ishimotonii]GBC62215.1 MBOAT family protein [Desulfonema ishimotonii]
MLFNSFIFLIFFIVVYSLYGSMSDWSVRKLILLGASYFFYAWWNPPFTLLLILSTVVDFITGRRIACTRNPAERKIWLTASLGVNLGVLFFFKYANFFAQSFSDFTRIIGLSWQYVHDPWDIILPLGISFYTFQSMSYTLDIYKGTLRPAKNFTDFALYVSFFPQLVAGPIIRATDYLWQCRKPPVIGSAQISWGIFLFSWGFFKKSVIADNVAIVVNEIFALPAKAGVLDAWIAVYGFAIQIYCDFSGYSDMAIGLALMLGFHFPDNFNRPYGALGFSDFWRRWHISLSSWLRDYLYISMGGNRMGNIRTYINLMLTMLIGGLWHGANWTFVVWGGLHGFYLAVERAVFQRFRLRQDAAVSLPLWQQILLCLIVFHLVCLAWVFFRAQSITEAFDMVSNMVFLKNSFLLSGERLVRKAAIACLTFIVVGWHFFSRNRGWDNIVIRIPALRVAAITAFLFTCCLLAGADANDFIYFQF